MFFLDKNEFTIGICVHNERKGLDLLLNNLLKQNSNFRPEFIVVCSECNDGSVELVKEFKKTYNNINLIEEPVRKGKRSAINLILKNSSYDSIVMLPADVIVNIESVKGIINSLNNAEVGCVGGRVKVLPRKKESLITNVSKVLWEFHDIALIRRSMEHRIDHASGELIAWKKSLVNYIPQVINDDGWVAYKVLNSGRKIGYNRNSTVYILTPWSLGDYFNQRLRIAQGLRSDKKEFFVPSYRNRGIINKIESGIFILSLTFKRNNVKIRYVITAIFLEILIKILSIFKPKGNLIWKISQSTKIT